MYSLAIFLMLAHVVFSQQTNEEWPVLKTYAGKFLDEVAMPLGGIGTGTVSLGGRGDLRDWELMNRGALGYLPAFKFVPPTIANGPFFALYYRQEGSQAGIRILEGPVPVSEYDGDWGSDAVNSGFPRFEETSFSVAYPLAQVEFKHKDVPLMVRLEAFNPLVVGDAEKSGIPVAVLRYVLSNPTDKPIEAAICGMVPNYIGVDGWGGEPKGNRNEFRSAGSLNGIYMYSEGVDPRDVNWGTMALSTTTSGRVSYRTSWARLAWNWTFREFWDDFIADGELTDHPDSAEPGGDKGKEEVRIQTPPATLAVKVKLAPGESKPITFILSWHFPNRRAWDCGTHYPGNYGGEEIVGNYYATLYKDAWEVARTTAPELEVLEKETVKFVSALVNCDIPDVIKEAGLFNLNNLRSQTVFRTADGLPFGFEGTGSIKGTRIGAERSSGWGFGSEISVWAYESTVPFLFGDLSLKFREVEFMHATRDDGAIASRVGLPLELRGKNMKVLRADGQMATLVRLYRDWQLSGNDAKLLEMWPNAKKAMRFAWEGSWDQDKDGVMEGRQTNTFDSEEGLVGPNPQMAGWYLAALKASGQMALHLDDKAFARECLSLYEKGSRWVDDNLFNGEYYEQQIPEGVSRLGQLGKGCQVDQLAGQYLAHTAGLGYVLDPDHVKTTLKSVMKYNYTEDFNDRLNTFRSFVLDDEAGLVILSYPHGGLLDFPQPYYTEVMTGFEYSTAAHMIYEGQLEAGLKVYQSVRDRFDGYKRNPFNEGEYGHRYARAMAAWAGIPAYTGFQYSAVEKSMSFNSRPGKYFWSNGYQYGIVKIREQGDNSLVSLTCLKGELPLKSFSLNGYGRINFRKGKIFGEGETVDFLISKD